MKTTNGLGPGILGPTADFRRRSVADLFTSLKLLVNMCQRFPPDVEDVLLRPDDQAIEMELLRCVRDGVAVDDGGCCRQDGVEHGGIKSLKATQMSE